jgi:hypothetical protein
MSTLTYPSEDNPGPRPVSLEIPDTWERLAVPAVVLAARQKERNAGFTPNVIVRQFTRNGLDQRADILMELQKTLDGKAGASMSQPVDVDLNGTAFSRVEVGFDDPSGIRVEQIHVFASFPRADGLQDFIQITGGVGAPGGDEDREAVEKTIASVRVTA